MSWLPVFSINDLSAFNAQSEANVSVVLKGYYDGSGTWVDPNTARITLAGFAGSPGAWGKFEAKWPDILRGDGITRPSCRYLHMNELHMLEGEYRGWEEPHRERLLKDVYAYLYSVSWNRANNFRALICTVDKADYAKACQSIPDLVELSPEDICVDHVGMWTLRMIPNDDTTITGKSGSVELFFDQNERFRGKLMPRWNKPWSKRDRLFKCMAAINEADMRLTPGLQASDYIAWNTNRYRSRGDISAHFRRILSSRAHEVFFGYDELIKTYQVGWER